MDISTTVLLTCHFAFFLFCLQTDTYPLLSEYFSTPSIGGPKLKAMVLGNDQTEIFYWPFNTPNLGAANDHIWVKQWQRTQVLPVSVSATAEAFKKWFQGYQTQFGDHLYEFMARNPSSAPFVNCLLYKAVGGKNTEEVLKAPDAIHYQAGIDNLPCVDLEMGFKVNDDFSNVVVAWNYVVDQVLCSWCISMLLLLFSQSHVQWWIFCLLKFFFFTLQYIAVRIRESWRVPV